MEPLAAWVSTRLRFTEAAQKRPRSADLPAAAVHTINIDLRSGTRQVETQRFGPPAPPRLFVRRAVPHVGRVIKAQKPRELTCPMCSTQFLASNSERVVCSRDCQYAYIRQRRGELEAKRAAEIEAMATTANGNAPRHAPSRIIWECASEWNVTVAMILGPSRYRSCARPRFAAAALLLGHFGFSQPRIARELRRECHTSVAHEIKRCAEMRRDDPEFSARYDAAAERCRQALGLAGDAP